MIQFLSLEVECKLDHQAYNLYYQHFEMSPFEVEWSDLHCKSCKIQKATKYIKFVNKRALYHVKTRFRIFITLRTIRPDIVMSLESCAIFSTFQVTFLAKYIFV